MNSAPGGETRFARLVHRRALIVAILASARITGKLSGVEGKELEEPGELEGLIEIFALAKK